MKVAVIGAAGWVGRAVLDLQQLLREDRGYRRALQFVRLV